MAARSTRSTDTHRLNDLITAAVAAGTPADVAHDAALITLKRFRDGKSGPRARAYFWGVVRRRALAGAAPVMTRSLVVASLARELSDAGHTPDAIRREVTRLHGAKAAESVLVAAGQPSGWAA